MRRLIACGLILTLSAPMLACGAPPAEEPVIEEQTVQDPSVPTYDTLEGRWNLVSREKEGKVTQVDSDDTYLEFKGRGRCEFHNGNNVLEFEYEDGTLYSLDDERDTYAIRMGKYDTLYMDAGEYLGFKQQKDADDGKSTVMNFLDGAYGSDTWGLWTTFTENVKSIADVKASLHEMTDADKAALTKSKWNVFSYIETGSDIVEQPVNSPVTLTLSDDGKSVFEVTNPPSTVDLTWDTTVLKVAWSDKVFANVHVMKPGILVLEFDGDALYFLCPVGVSDEALADISKGTATVFDVLSANNA